MPAEPNLDIESILRTLARHAIEMRIDEGLTVRLLDLETLIRTKQGTAGEKDFAVLAILRRILEEKPASRRVKFV